MGWSHWHVFTGDMSWQPAWPAPSLETACGYSTSPMMDVEEMEITLEPPASPCRRCLALVARAEAAR
jgi:hypothetical protein